MTIPIIASVIRALWLVGEILHQRKQQVKLLKNLDRNSGRLWDVANAIEPVGMILGFTRIGRIQTGSSLIALAGLGLLILGIIIRWTAIRDLGKYFTSTVRITENHRLIRTGMYEHLRHPAYTGALVAHVGLGLAFTNWYSLALSSIPFFVAAMYRIHVEEQVLVAEFGQEYLDYARNTKRLIPKVY
jgi:protein-S-isoprenylcysteine O-methyltransferase Ste14